MRVVRVYHSAVVPEWRKRDRLLRAAGIDLTLVSPRSWNEGGSTVHLDAGSDQFVRAARTIGRHPFAFVYDPRPIWRALRAGPLDVLDIHEEPASLAAAEILLLRWLSRRRPPVLFYGAENLEKRYPPPFRWLEKLALRRAEGVYCCNERAGEVFRRKGFKGVVTIVGLGVDIERFSPGEPLPEPPFRVGFVGRLQLRKGLSTVLDALAWLPGHIELDVYGTGPDAEQLQRHASRLGLGPRVRFHGFVNHADLPETYRGLHALVVPSRTTARWVEQFGRVVVEAMASGLPVIGSDSGSIPEVIGDAGVVVAEDDVEVWKLAISELAGSADRRAELAAAGRARVERYSWRSIAAAHAALYDEVVAG